MPTPADLQTRLAAQIRRADRRDARKRRITPAQVRRERDQLRAALAWERDLTETKAAAASAASR